MAVVQISKIQIRRGLKNSTSGVPQLSSAEMAWAVDSQELFIGNGSVAEGAPYVGNTKIITEHDNILDLASSYRFANSDTAIVNSVFRSLQIKLDEYVSVSDFGIVGDGITDVTDLLQNALDDLFKSTDTKYKKVLIIPNGEYVVNSRLRIPSNTILRGESQDRTIINIGSSTVRLVSFDGKEFEEFNSTTRAESIIISNLTIKRTTGSLVLSGIKDSQFDNVIIKGNYELGDPVSSVNSEIPAVFWQNPSAGVAVTNLKFSNCKFENNTLSVKCIQTLVFETKVDFENCKFFVNEYGIYIEGVAGQSNRWKISSSEFEQTASEAILITNGRDTLIENSSFINCGNGTGTALYPETAIVYFGEKVNNRVINCSSNRQQFAGITDSETRGAIVEIENADKAVFIDRVYSPIYLSDNFRPLAVFSAKSKHITINYFLQIGSVPNFKFSRIGQITISLGDDLTGSIGSDISFTDSYQYSPNFISTTGGITMTSFEFSVSLRSNNTLDDSTGGINTDTILLSYRNPLARGATGTISFDVTYGV